MEFKRFLSEEGITSYEAKQRLLQRSRELFDMVFDALDPVALDLKAVTALSIHMSRLSDLEQSQDSGEGNSTLLDDTYTEVFEDDSIT